MYWFVFLATLLVALVFLFLLPPLWRQPRRVAGYDCRSASNIAIFRMHFGELERERQRGELSEHAYEQDRRELQRRLLDDVDETFAGKQSGQYPGTSRRLAAVLAILLPLAAAGAYLVLGDLRALDPVAVMSPEKLTPPQMEAMVGKLAQRLRANPDDMQGWLMLARSYRSLGQPEKAADAYDKAGPVVFDSPDLLTDYADLLAMINGGSLSGKPIALVNQALHIDPDHVIALWLAGTAAFNGKDFPSAILFWQRALKVLPPDSEDARSLSDAIAEARKRITSQRTGKSQ